MHLNMDTLHTAFNLSQAQDKELADHVAQFKDQVANIPKESIVDSSVPSDQVMKKGYQAHGMAAIPDGYVPVYDQDGKQIKDENGIPKSQLTYTIYNPASTGDLNKLVNVQDAAAAGIKPFDKATNFPEGATITHLAAQQINNEIADRKYILDTANRINQTIDPKAPVVTMDKLKSALAADPTLADAFHKYKLTAGASTEPDGRLDALRQKDPQAAGKLQQFFGDENLQAYKQAREISLASGKAMGAELAKEQTPAGQRKAATEELAN